MTKEQILALASECGADDLCVKFSEVFLEAFYHAARKPMEVALETERIRLAACGVVAMSDTPESAAKSRQMKDEYRSASCDDVARRVDECMALRQQLSAAQARIVGMEKKASEPVGYKHRSMNHFIGVIRYQQARAEVKAEYLPLYLRAPQTIPEDFAYSTPCEEFEAAIKKFGIVGACEWFGYASNSEFTEKTRQHFETAPSPEGVVK